MCHQLFDITLHAFLKRRHTVSLMQQGSRVGQTLQEATHKAGVVEPRDIHLDMPCNEILQNVVQGC